MKLSLAIVAVALAAVACANPAKDKPRAQVGTAIEQAAMAPVAAPPASSVGEPAAAVDPTASEAPAPAPDAGEIGYFLRGGTRIQFTGSKVTRKHDGSFPRFKGSIRVPNKDFTKSRISVEIDMNSVMSDTEKLTEHLKTDDFFDVAKFPTGSFESTSIVKAGDAPDAYTITGNMTLRGKTKSLTFPATLTHDEGGIKGVAEFVINRKDFGIAYPGAADDLIRDDVVLKLTLLGAKE